MNINSRKLLAWIWMLVGCSTFANLVEAEEPLSRIFFGSCIKEQKPMPIFEAINRQKPEMFIFLGDNIYADTDDMSVMKAKYGKLKADQGFAQLFNSTRILATWDDHDYGKNDAGLEYTKRAESQRIFVDFWEDSADSIRRRRPGVYDSRVFGPTGKRVQVILLDTRYFRGPLQKAERRTGGPYVPTQDKSTPMLGEPQWKWLAKQLKQPAEIRIIASSIQCVAESAGQETWSNLPHERERFLKLIESSKANGVIIVSGDRHWSEVSVSNEFTSYPIYDITSSSLNQPHGRGTPTKNTRRAIPLTYHKENYGAINIDWDKIDPQIHFEIRNMNGEPKLKSMLRLSELQVD